MTVTLITGANRGIGHETARQLAELGHTGTDLNAAMPGGRPVAESARGVVAMATTGVDGPTGVLVEDGETLPW